MAVRDAVTYQATDLARNHRDVIDAARGGGALIRDKDGTTLVMAPAAEISRTQEIADLALDLLRVEQALESTEAPRSAASYGGLAWLSVLPDDSQRRFLTEVGEELLMAASGTSLAPVGHTLADWRATAEAWADPETRDALLADEVAPLRDVEL
jgi:hypothetical protein